ncbi:unnamed protein product [Parajaminaea phylloscopi]
MVDSRLPNANASSSTSSALASSSSSSLARQVDAFAVYEEAVQTPGIECANLASLYYNAQPIGSPRPDAKVLREDFSSTAAVAVHWLSLHASNRSQAVDIDLDALKIARRRLLDSHRAPLNGGAWRCRLLQHGDLSDNGTESRWLDELPVEQQPPMASGSGRDTDAPEHSDAGKALRGDSTWEKGATTDRFERRFQARQNKERQRAKSNRKRAQNQSQPGDSRGAFSGNLDRTVEEEEAPHLTLLHSSVLSLPVPAPPSAAGTKDAKACPPDIVASLNYALSYFHRRTDLVAYLTSVRQSLRPGTGVLICDQFAGPLGEAARQAYGHGRELSAEEEEAEQDELWQRFMHADGFLRAGETPNNLPSRLDAATGGVQVWTPTQDSASGSREQLHSQDGASAAVWPRGRLSLVRTGTVPHSVRDEKTGEVVGSRDVTFEYWREDTPVDLVTNRFRMSLSFRFVEDGSFVRDFFSYDFRFWTLTEVLEAMEEAGFAEVTTEVLDRGAGDEDAPEGPDSEADRRSQLSLSDRDDDEMGFEFLRQVEKSAAKPTATYRKLTHADGEKVFARRSFGTYVVARAPP